MKRPKKKASENATPLIFVNLFGLKFVPSVPDTYGLPRLSVNDLIIDLAQGLCPPRFTDWYNPRYAAYRGRLPWKYQPEYAQLPEYDLATLEECLHFLEIGLVPDTELRLYALLHALNWGQRNNVVFVQMQEDVQMLMRRKHITYDDKEAVIQGLECMISDVFEPYMTLDLEWEMGVKKQQLEEIMLPSQDWDLVDKKLLNGDFPILALVKDRAGHPIPDLRQLHWAMTNERMLPGFIMNPYVEFEDQCPADVVDLLAIVPEYVQTEAYDMVGLLAALKDLGQWTWTHLCVVIHLTNYGLKDHKVTKAIMDIRDKVDSGKTKPLAHPYNYLMKVFRNDNLLTIIAPKKLSN